MLWFAVVVVVAVVVETRTQPARDGRFSNRRTSKGSEVEQGTRMFVVVNNVEKAAANVRYI